MPALAAAARARTTKEVLNELQRSQGGMTPLELMKASEQLATRSSNQVDIGYIKTLLFPELYNSDIPQPMSTQSYTRFTDKKEISVPSNGESMLLWYPKTNCGPQLFMRKASATPGTPVQPVAQPADLVLGNWTVGGWQDYSPYFTQTNLVSASISIQYVGQLQNEQGYFVGSQLYGVNPQKITTDDIENGQFRVLSKPGDGVRLVYLPKDMSDFTYYSCGSAGNINRTRNAGGKPETDVVDLVLSAAVAADYIEGVKPASQVPAQVVNPYRYNVDGDCIAIYWKGLSFQGSPKDLRIDLVRKFNGFPQASQRDVLDLIKPRKLFDPKKTIDVVTELQMAVPQLCGHSLKQMDRVSDQIQEFLPNVGHLYSEGMLKEGSSIEGFAEQLQMIAGTEGNGVTTGRIYD